MNILRVAKIITKLTVQQKWWNSEKKEAILILMQDLLTRSSSFKPSKTIALLYKITMAKYDPELSELLSDKKLIIPPAQIESLYNQISSDLHLIPHNLVNKILEILKQNEHYYDNHSPLHRNLSKHMKQLFGKHFHYEEIFKTLHMCKILNFPKITTNMMIQKLLNDESKIISQIPSKHFLKIAIICVEEPSFTLISTKKMIEKVIKLRLDQLDNLCLLYHLTQILRPCLKKKIEYGANKLNVRSLLFNPYSLFSQNEQQSKDQQPLKNQNSPPEVKNDNNQYLQQVTKQLQSLSEEIIKIFVGAIDLTKLQQSIFKYFSIETPSKQSIMFACTIVKLKPIIQNYLQKHLLELIPLEFIHLSKQISIGQFKDYFNLYFQHFEKQMTLEEAAYLHLQNNKITNEPIRAQTILKLMSPLSSINYKEFKAIGKLTEQIHSQDKPQIGKILQKLKQLVENKPN